MVKKNILTVLFLCTIVLFYSCDAFKTTTSPEETLKERINLLMTSKLNGDWATVYDLYNTNFKNKISKKSFNRSKNMTFISYRIESLEMDTSKKMADAVVKSEIETGGYTLKDVPENQHWIIENGEWFLAVKPVTGFID